MNEPEETIEALAGAPEGEIELARVERELAALWAQAAPEDPGSEPAVLRACSLNLLVLGGGPEALEPARKVAAATTLAHPSRILLMAAEEVTGDRRVPAERVMATGGQRDSVNHRPESPREDPPYASNGVGARISTFCHRVGSAGKHVCCEEIMLVARGTAAERLREAALPLLVPDLPVVCWVPDDRRQATGDSPEPAPGIEAAISSRLSPAAYRLIELADTVIWSDRGAGDQLPAQPNRSRQPVSVDLDWLRLQPWRELTAQLFDSPEHRPLLERLEGVEITVAGPLPARPGTGWLWVGWLASRLGWEDLGEAAGAGARRLRSARGAVTARVHAGPMNGLDAGEPLAVRLQVQDRAEPLVLERLPAPEPCDLWVEGQGGRCVRLGRRDQAALLSEALGCITRDRVYEAAWAAAVHLTA